MLETDIDMLLMKETMGKCNLLIQRLLNTNETLSFLLTPNAN